MSRGHNPLPSIKDLSRHNAEKSGGAVAFEDWDESVTWAEFDDRSARAASVFSRHAGSGDRIGFYCEQSVQHAALYVGALKAGAVVTNFHTRTAPRDLRYCIETTRPRVIVVDAGLQGPFFEAAPPELLETCTVLVTRGEPSRDDPGSLDETIADEPAREPDVRSGERDVITVAWTSGSTGRPKGWCHTNRTMYLKGMELATRTGFSRSEKQLVVNKPSFLIWTSFLVRSLLGCESTYYMREWDPIRWLETVEREGITRSVLVPTMWREVLDSDPESYDLGTLESINSTGEKLSPATLEQLRERICPDVNQSYGSTEIHSTVLYDGELTDDRIESVGKPQSGTEVRIVDPEGPVDAVRDPNESGEIVVRSPDAPVWVWGDDEATEAAFVDGWWRSGDLGYVDEEGFLYIEGRVDFQLKSKGVKIVPATIEEVLTDHPAVTNAVVVGTDDEEYGQKVTAIVEGSTADVTESELDEWCRESEKLADHERPREYRFVDSIERTPSGKLDRIRTKERLGLE